MKFQRLFPALTLVFSIIAFPALSFSEIKIELKNGKSIIADTCRNANGKLTCDMMGGTFEIDKNDIENMKEITVKHKDLLQPGTEETKNEDGETAPAKTEPFQKTDKD